MALYGDDYRKCSKASLPDILKYRFMNNFDIESEYFEKNNRKVHWAELSSADDKNICKRWFEYILNPALSGDKFFFNILGVNVSYLNIEEFDTGNKFNSIYNRFFRSSVKYSLKKIFGNKNIIIKNIYHEQGQQQEHPYFPWHAIYKLDKEEPNFSFETTEIVFLQKDHKIDEKSNLIQLCDCLLGAITSIIHGFEESSRVHYKKELLDMLLPLVDRMINNPNNKNSSYAHSNRIMISFFPKTKNNFEDLERKMNQFFTVRKLKYQEDKIGNLSLFD